MKFESFKFFPTTECPDLVEAVSQILDTEKISTNPVWFGEAPNHSGWFLRWNISMDPTHEFRVGSGVATAPDKKTMLWFNYKDGDVEVTKSAKIINTTI